MAEENEGRVKEIENSVDALESQVRAQIARTQSGTRAMLVIGIILIAIIFIYMTLIVSKFKKEMEPKTLALTLQGLAEPKIDEALAALEKTAMDRKSEIVGSLLNEVMERIPMLRKKAEKAVTGLVDQFADQLDGKVDQIVAEMLEQKKKELDPLIEAAAEKGATEALEKEFTRSLEDTIGPKMDEVLMKYHGTLAAIEARLEMLQKPDDQLTSEQRLEKEVIAAILIFIDDAVKEHLSTPPAPAE